MAKTTKSKPVESAPVVEEVGPTDAERIARLERAVTLLVEYASRFLGPQGTARLRAALDD